MSGLAYLGWIDPDGKHRCSAVALQVPTVERIVEQMKQSRPGTSDRVVRVEEIDTWMEQ